MAIVLNWQKLLKIEIQINMWQLKSINWNSKDEFLGQNCKRRNMSFTSIIVVVCCGWVMVGDWEVVLWGDWCEGA